MKAVLLKKTAPIETRPLELADVPVPNVAAGKVLVKISACGVCHTELDEIEGRLTARLPVIPGHEIIGRVEAKGQGASRFKVGDRVGIAWINSACGTCRYCRAGLENMCESFKGTGCDVDGGYAEYVTVREEFAYPIPARFTDVQAAPLLCAGAIGYRDLKLADVQRGQVIGLFGFGASAHIVLQMAKHRGCAVYVFTRGEEHRRLAKELGADWTGTVADTPPRRLDRAIDFTPVGETVPQALGFLDKGGRLVIAVIRKRTPIPPLDYARLLWEEREIKSVANITRKDVEEFLPLAAQIPIIPETQEFPLEKANDALILLKQGGVRGAAVLTMGGAA